MNILNYDKIKRSLIEISGKDSSIFLQKIITADVNKITERELYPAALLSPQGKILYHFLITKFSDKYYIDIDQKYLDTLLMKLNLYRLSSEVDFTAVPDVTAVISNEIKNIDIVFVDKCFPTPIYRIYDNFISLENLASDQNILNLNQLFIDNGLAQIDHDFSSNEVYPHDINFDLYHGVNFNKGCYVGQEVVARMQYKATIKKRTLIIQANEILNKGDKIYANDKLIGSVGQSCGKTALALIRIDHLKNAPKVHCNNIDITITAPYYLDLALN